jgi:Right handed beta helix region
MSTQIVRNWIKKLSTQLLGGVSRRSSRSRLAAPKRITTRRPEIDQLEDRVVPATWTPLTNLNPDPSGAQSMILLSNGSVLVQGGADSSSANWYTLTPDSSGSYINGTFTSAATANLGRLFFATNVLPDGRVLNVGGEYTGPSTTETDTNTGEIYDPVANTWTNIATFPQSNFGDDPSETLSDGTVLAGYLSGPQTYLYNPATDSWAATGTKLLNDQSDEETWVKLPPVGLQTDGDILSFDVFASGHAQKYQVQDPNTGAPSNTWIDAGNVPVTLTNSGLGYELGPAFLLPNGNVFQIGANSNTAIYSPSTNSWTQGPTIPNAKGCDDAPGVMLPNGHVLFLADTYSPLFTAPTQIFDYDPVANTITQESAPAGLTSVLNSQGAFLERMLSLPNGDVLLSDSSNQIWEYTPDGGPSASWEPTISSIAPAGSASTFTLTGTQITGISEGACYGDDAEMSSNYPIIQLTSGGGTVYYARSYDWSTTAVATGSTLESTQFQVPSSMPAGTYSLKVIANGIASAATTFTYNGPIWVVTNPNGAAGSGSANDVTLPYAIAHSQDGDEITFDPCLNGSTILLNSTLTISHDIDIIGPGAASLAVSGGNSVQDFFADAGFAFIQGLTIENGTETGVGGGGGILNTGTLDLYQCVISGNNGSSSGPYNPSGSGGGILNTGTLYVTDCTFEGNIANWGGGLENYGAGASSYIYDSTFTGNSGGSGAGVNDFEGGALSLSNSTVADNFGYGVYVTSMDNCIVADNTLGSIYAGTSGTYTLTSVTGLASTLAYNNGAPTPTLALLPGSSAIGNGDPSWAGSSAQNGAIRASGAVDPGACQGGYDWVVTDPNGNGGSGSPSDITLPYAVANVDSGDWITFSPTLNGDTIPLNATLTLGQNVSIIGPGAANLAISGGGAVQDFFVNSAVTASISGLTIENGTETNGGGGGILNTGDLTVSDCLIAHNDGTSSGFYNPYGSGGGILNTGLLQLSDSTIEANVASWGGGVENYGSSADAFIDNCTFTGNSGGSGAGVNNYDGNYLSLTNSTVAYNNGYGVSTSYMDNCIVADNSGPAIWAGPSGTFTLTSVTGLASSLAYNGGSTPTLALLPGSSATGTGDPGEAGTIAQNGAERDAGSVDVGASQGGYNWVVTDFNGNAGSGSLNDITLPYAVSHAQDGDSISFSDCLDGDTITLNATLTISSDITISGPGAANLAVSGNHAVQDFFVNSGECATITGLTIENGTENGLGGGGGILNLGMLNVSGCVISGNNGSSAGTYNPFGSGGGILNTGLLTLSDSTVDGNIANWGGGVENYNGGSMSINDCTFTGNTGSSGAGVNDYAGGPLNLSNSTIAYNNGDGVYVTAMDNCIVAGNTSGAIYAGTSGTYTLTSVTGLSATLAYNGGSTPTLALTPGSSALGVGDPGQAGTTAQNGVVRPAGNVAVGAFQGADWVVTDPNGNAGSGSLGDVTLPYAVANAQDGDSITFASYLSGDTIVLNSTLTIGHSYTITGLGSANLAVSGGNSVQDFIVNAGVTTTISGLTIENGSFASLNFGTSDGAGIANNGVLTLNDDAISNNGTIGNGVIYLGAGVYNTGNLSVDNCTFTGNVSYYDGGGLCNSGNATVTNSTFFANAAYTAGGGICNFGRMTLSDSTVAGNYGWDNDPSFPEVGGGVYNGGTLQMDNTIVAGNGNVSTNGPDVSGTIAVANYDLIGNPSGATYSGTGNLTGSAGLTAVLAYNNGAPTQTLALMPGSQALGAGDPNQAGTTAQNGITRAVGYVDIGACQGGVSWVVTDPNGNFGSGSPLDITLPYAVSHAQDGDTITFAGALSGDTIVLNSTLVINHDYTISGLGSTHLAVSGNNAVQDFYVSPGACTTILGLTLENGLAADGGGIENRGMLTLIDDAVSNNATLNNIAFAGYNGAGIFNSGILSVYGSTINGNSAYTNGGGVYNSGTATLSNSTIFGNAAFTAGGGLFNSGSMTLINDTVAGNFGYGGSPSLPELGGGIYNGGTLQMDNTIVANNVTSGSGPDIYGTIASASYCLIGNTSGNSISSGFSNLLNVSAGLASSLAYNGGPTQTLALLAGSPAISAGDPGQAGTYAQNGLLRPGAPSIGAYQFQAPPPNITNVVINENLSALYNAPGQPAPGTQRSMVNDIVYTFSEAVNIVSSGVDPSVFTVAVAAGWTGTVPTLSWAPVTGSGNTEWAVTFSGGSVTGGSIANGAYTITVNHPSEITAVSDSQQLSLAGSGIGSATQSFYRLFGDINGDEFVNASDNAKFKIALGAYNPAFDFTQDGFVNASDNAKFKADLVVNFSGFTHTI